MTDYTELVKALRIRSGNLCPGDICDRCEAIHFLCSDKVMHDAAAAIEALQAQLPKRGEWVWDDKRCIYVCSVCGSPKVRENMDRQIIKEQAYCYSCGAKMREAQE